MEHSTHAHRVLALAWQRPLLRARDLAALSVPTVVLSRLVAAGQLGRLTRGVYSVPGSALSEHRWLAEAALRVHGIGTQAPFEVCMAIPPHTAVPRFD